MDASPADPPPVLRLDAARFAGVRNEGTFDLELFRGEIRHLGANSPSLQILGVLPLLSGSILVNGRSWETRDVADREAQLRRIGTVHHPRGASSSIWISNLDIDENARLAGHFDPERGSAAVAERAEALAHRFGLAEGLPTTRPAVTALREQILAQWVRAFLPEPLDLLLLESPLLGAPVESIPALVAEIEHVRGTGCPVLWISEDEPDFAKLGIRAHLDEAAVREPA